MAAVLVVAAVFCVDEHAVWHPPHSWLTGWAEAQLATAVFFVAHVFYQAHLLYHQRNLIDLLLPGLRRWVKYSTAWSSLFRL